MNKLWKKSIRYQLLVWLIVPMLSLALLNTLASYLLGLGLARSIYDKELANSADSVIARIKLNGEKVTVDLPLAAIAMLKPNYKDEFYFQVTAPDGRIIYGDDLLPPPPVPEKAPEIETALSGVNPSRMLKGEDPPVFRTVNIHGRELRVVSLVVPLAESVFDYVVIQAAETRNTRKGLAGQITVSILLAQLALIVCGVIAIWIGVGRGLRPLARVESAVQARAAGDLGPLNVDAPVEIASLIDALNRLFRHLENDVDLQKRFTSNAAHQLRTPLAVVTTYCELACRMVDDVEVHEVLGELSAGIGRMSRLVNQLLVLARSEPGVAIVRPFANVELSEIACAVTAAHVPEAIRKRIELEFIAPPESAVVYGDQSGLTDLIANLIENSILYSHVGCNVIVKVAVEQSKVILTVLDDGSGIEESERERIFERFYRIADVDQPGTGLGLAIVKEIVAAHNAIINVTSGNHSRGTCMSVVFPRQTGKAEL